MIYETYNDGQIHPNHYYTELSDESRNKVIDSFLSLVSDIGNNEAVIIIDNCSLNLYEDIRRKIPTNIKVILQLMNIMKLRVQLMLQSLN